MKVAIQGVAGSFHHIVAQKWFGETVTIVPCETFADVFSALETGLADQAIVAVENSLYGSLNEVSDLLYIHDFPIVGEVPERIHQQLISFAGTKLTDITRVYSHPVALSQCETFLEAHLPQVARIEHFDTADSVRLIHESGDHSAAAIAPHLAASLYDMSIIHESIEDAQNNSTRFLILSPDAKQISDANKASLVLRTNHSPGALHRALGIFANVGCNLTKLQSRPIRGEVWRYQFYIDVEITADILPSVLSQLKRSDCEVRVLGHYKKHREEEVS